jgi:anti-anti-sigma factor
MKAEVFTSTRGETCVRWEASKPVARAGRAAARGGSVEVTVSDFGDAGKRVTLAGRLDILGAEEVDLPLSVVAGSGTGIVVDLGGVDFIGSLAMRHLVVAAKTVARRSRNLVLLNPRPLVRDALTKAGLVTILRIVESEDEAKAALSR